MDIRITSNLLLLTKPGMYTQVLGARRGSTGTDDGRNGGIVLINGDRSINGMANREEKVTEYFRPFRSTTIGADL